MIVVNHFNPAFKLDDRWAYDWYIRSESRWPRWSGFRDWILQEAAALQVFDQKQEIPMYNFVEHLPYESAHKSATRGGALLRKRNARANMIAMTALALDFESKDYPVECFIEEHSWLSYVLHTTYNHLAPEKGGAPAYRVIVELSSPIPCEILTADTFFDSIIPALLEVWPHVDVTCFQPDRAIFRPGFCASRIHEAIVCTNDGGPFDWTVLEVTPGRPVVPYTPPPANLVERGASGRPLLGTMDLLSFFKDRGSYKGPAGGGKHAVVCPNAASHSSGSASAIFDAGGHWGYKCMHAHCAPGNARWLKDFVIATEGLEAVRPYCECRLGLTAEPATSIADIVSALRLKGKKND